MWSVDYQPWNCGGAGGAGELGTMQMPGPCPPAIESDSRARWSPEYRHPEDAGAASISAYYLISSSHQPLTETVLSLGVRLKEVKWVAQGMEC